jgi:membrane-associated phospholipid phosphatase
MYQRRDKRMTNCLCSALTKMCYSQRFQISHYTMASLMLFRIPEAMYVIITAGVALGLAYRTIPANGMQIPEILIPTALGSNITVLNPTYNYPIKLNVFSCYATNIYACITLKQSGAALTEGCCVALYNDLIVPYQEVPNRLLDFLGIILPFLIFIIRSIDWRYYISRQYPTHSSQNKCVSSFQSAFLCVFSIPAATLDVLLRQYLSRERNVNNHYQNKSNVTRFQKGNRGMRYSDNDDQILAVPKSNPSDPDMSDEARYEILDNAGNVVNRASCSTSSAGIGTRETREMRDIESNSNDRLRAPLISDILSGSFQDSTARSQGLGLGLGSGIAPSPSPLQHMFWLLLVYEPTAGLLISLAFQGIICLGLKRFVGAPRPNYYALTAWASVYSNRETDAVSAMMSFPSGHSSTAAAGLGYVVLVLLDDIRKLKAKHWRLSFYSSNCSSNSSSNNAQITSISPLTGLNNEEEEMQRNPGSSSCDTVSLILFFSLIIMLCVSLILWIGASRIKDYYHFAPDVIGKNIPTPCLILLLSLPSIPPISVLTFLLLSSPPLSLLFLSSLSP